MGDPEGAPRSAGLSQTDIIAIGVGCGGALLLLLVIVLFIIIHRRKNDDKMSHSKCALEEDSSFWPIFPVVQRSYHIKTCACIYHELNFWQCPKQCSWSRKGFIFWKICSFFGAGYFLFNKVSFQAESSLVLLWLPWFLPFVSDPHVQVDIPIDTMKR